jgi:hypothetical protein
MQTNNQSTIEDLIKTAISIRSITIGRDLTNDEATFIRQTMIIAEEMRQASIERRIEEKKIEIDNLEEERKKAQTKLYLVRQYIDFAHKREALLGTLIQYQGNQEEPIVKSMIVDHQIAKRKHELDIRSLCPDYSDDDIKNLLYNGEFK